MKTTIEQKRAKGVALLQQLGVYKPYIKDFREKGQVTFFIQHFGYYLSEGEKELYEKVKEFEAEHGGLVYAVLNHVMEDMECYAFLYVPNDDDDWDALVDPINSSEFYAFAYIWNKDCDMYSEFGDIVVRSAYGGIKRIH